MCGLYINDSLWNYRDLLNDINILSHVLYRADEFLTSVFEDYSDLLGNSETMSIAGASHFIFNEKPEEFNKAVKKFLNK